MLRVAFCLTAILGCSLDSRADVTSGPETGEKVEAFKVFGVTGLVEGKEFDAVKDRKDELTVYVFVQSEHWSRPIARYLKTLDKQSKEANDKVKVIAVWLTEKVDDAKSYLPKANMSLQFANTSLTVYDGEKSGPKGWNINTDAHLTVVVVDKGKVAARFAYLSTNEADVPKVRAEIEKVTGKK